MEKQDYFNLAIIGIIENIDHEKDIISLNNEGEIIRIYMSKVDIDNIEYNQEIKVYIKISKIDTELVYGYLNKSTRDFLGQFENVAGLGTKVVMRMYSYFITQGMTLKDICFEVSVGNYELFKNVPGLGEKTAIRLVDSLKDIIVFEDKDEIIVDNVCVSEAIETLKSLGFVHSSINNVINQINITNDMNSMDIVQIAIEKLQHM